MSRNRILALLSIALLLGACTTTQLAPRDPSAQLGTVAPAYAVGEILSPGIKVIDHIPTEKLTTAGSAALDKQDPCRSVPGHVVAPVSFAPTPDERGKEGCGWIASGLALAVSASPPVNMLRSVTEHIDAAKAFSENPLAHLAWLLVDGHYVIERIAKSDPSSGCWLSLDLGSPTIAFVVVVALDLATKEPVTTTPEESVIRFCPRARTVAQNLLHHLLDNPLGPAGSGVFPTR